MALSAAQQIAANAIKNTKDAVADGRIMRWQDAVDAICGSVLVLSVSDTIHDADIIVPAGVSVQAGGFEPTVVNAPSNPTNVLDTDTVTFKPR